MKGPNLSIFNCWMVFYIRCYNPRFFVLRKCYNSRFGNWIFSLKKEKKTFLEYVLRSSPTNVEPSASTSTFPRCYTLHDRAGRTTRQEAHHHAPGQPSCMSSRLRHPRHDDSDFREFLLYKRRSPRFAAAVWPPPRRSAGCLPWRWCERGCEVEGSGSPRGWGGSGDAWTVHPAPPPLHLHQST